MFVALQDVGVAAVPLNVTVLVPCVGPKFVPVMVTDVPTGPEAGLRPVIVGAGAAEMVKVGGFGLVSGPPPGWGLNVSTLTVCGVARLAAGTWTVSVVEFVTVTAFAGSGIVLNCTSVPPARKLLPFTIKVNPLDPATAVVGEIEVIPGTGLRTVNGTALVVLPVSVTVICARAPFSSCADGIVVVHVVAVAQLVVKGVVTPPAAKFTIELAVKPLPFTVKGEMLEAPAFAVKGAIEVMPNAA